MTTHARLTEDSLRTHPRKGREGKGREQGREARSGSIHSVAYVTRASRDAWMTGADAPPGWAA